MPKCILSWTKTGILKEAEGLSLQRKHLLKRNYFFAFLILITGFGGLLGYDLYFKPYVLAQTVVKVKVAEGRFLPKNHELKAEDLYLDSVQTKDIPAGAVRDIREVERKVTNVNLTNGSILTAYLVDVSNVEPAADEGIFPVPKEAIYAINGSLRSRDKVDIYLVEGNTRNTSMTRELNMANHTDNNPPTAEGEAEPEPLNLPDGKAFLQDIMVNYVRSEDNNDVLDSEHGNTNNRVTSTGKVAVPELKLKKDDGQRLGRYLEQGKKLWIVRVE